MHLLRRAKWINEVENQEAWSSRGGCGEDVVQVRAEERAASDDEGHGEAVVHYTKLSRQLPRTLSRQVLSHV